MAQAREFKFNFALYNAPPGTWQRMAVYFYLSPDPPPATEEAVMAFTHDDSFKPLPGFKVAASHFHTHMNEEITDAGTLDWVPEWIPTFRALGINMLFMSDFHADSHPSDPGPIRLAEQKVYFDASRRHSDRDFLILPGGKDMGLSPHRQVFFPK